MVAWVIGAGWMYLTTGAVFTRFAKLLDMPKFGFGLLAAIPFAGALAQLPVSYIITRYGHRKPLFITLGLIHRGLWLVIAGIPWLLPAGWQWQGLILLFILTSMTGQMVTPIWVSWMADLVPSRIRGRYFSRRSQLGQMIGVIITLLMGFALDRAEIRGSQMLLQVVALALALGAVYGMIDFLFFLKVPDIQRVEPNPATNLWQMVREPLHDRNFRRFLGYTATLTFGIGFVGQFAWLYIFDIAGLSNAQANAMLVLIPLILMMIFTPIWGRIVDRFGRKSTLVLAGILVIPGSLGWIFVSRENWLWGYSAIVIATAAWPGIEIANFNVLLGMSDQAGPRSSGSAYVVVNSTLTAIAGILSGLFGGAVAQTLDDWKFSFAGITLTYHGVLFIISTLIRTAGLFWLVRFEDRQAGTPRAALRYLGTNLYSNLQQAVFIPGRLFQQLSRWTYQINKRRR
ncbi:MAG: hypothetical protein PCFJNLEI_04172 [Verrucomicrobiae bacterium]|nr:hypothetical protein [Verrucomicrobiae bacterium]